MEFACVLTASLTNPDVGDLQLTDEGDEVVRTELTDEVAQRLRVRLSFFKGEWFLNLEEGLPYYQSILVHGLKDKVVRAVFGDVIAQTPGVAQLLSLEWSVVKATRAMSLSFKCKLEDGSTFVSTNYPEFIVAG